MNEIVSKFSLAGDKFTPEMHLRQPGFTYSACRPFKKTTKNLKKQEIHDIFMKKNKKKLDRMFLSCHVHVSKLPDLLSG